MARTGFKCLLVAVRSKLDTGRFKGTRLQKPLETLRADLRREGLLGNANLVYGINYMLSDPMTPDQVESIGPLVAAVNEPLKLAREAYDYVLHRTESLETQHIGADLAYLLGAIVKDLVCEWPARRPIVKLLREGLPGDHPVWKHVQIEPQSGRAKGAVDHA